MDCSMPGLPIPHYLTEFAQVHVHWISDVIQPSQPLPPSSPFAFNLSQHQGLFQRFGCPHQVAKVLEFSASASVLPVSIQGWVPLGLTGCISLLSQGFSRVFSSTTIQMHQFFGAQPFMVQLSHWYIRSLGWENPLEEGMATHSSILAWRIPWTEEPGGLLSIGSHRVRRNWSDLNTHAHTGKTIALT